MQKELCRCDEGSFRGIGYLESSRWAWCIYKDKSPSERDGLRGHQNEDRRPCDDGQRGRSGKAYTRRITRLHTQY